VYSCASKVPDVVLLTLFGSIPVVITIREVLLDKLWKEPPPIQLSALGHATSFIHALAALGTICSIFVIAQSRSWKPKASKTIFFGKVLPAYSLLTWEKANSGFLLFNFEFSPTRISKGIEVLEEANIFSLDFFHAEYETPEKLASKSLNPVGATGSALVDLTTPLFQTNFLPDLIHVNVFPDATVVIPALLHLAPALAAAFAGTIGVAMKRANTNKNATILFNMSKS
jgi:hypothetical protein